MANVRMLIARLSEPQAALPSCDAAILYVEATSGGDYPTEYARAPMALLISSPSSPSSLSQPSLRPSFRS